MNIQSISLISFKGKRNNNQNFDNFKEYYLDKGNDSFFKESLASDMKVGEGMSNEVFKIPDNNSFLLRVNKYVKNPLDKILLKEAVDDFPHINIGQKIAHLNPNASIVITQKGIPCGIRHFNGAQIVKPIKEEVPFFINYLKTVSQFPQEAYDNLAFEIKQIYEKCSQFDFANPENILYDEKTKSFNIVDIEKKLKTRFINCDIIIPTALLDYENYFDMMKMSNSVQKDDILNFSAKIIKKSNNAYYKYNKISIEFPVDMYSIWRGLKHGKERATKFFRMKEIIKAMSLHF